MKGYLAIWLPTIKSWESPWNTCVQVVCHILLESSWQGLQLCFRHHPNKRSAQKIMGLHNRRNPNFENFETPNLGIVRQNDIWVQPPWPGTKNTCGGFPQVLWVCVCPWFVHAPKMLQLYALINVLFGLCKFMWIANPLITCPSPYPVDRTFPSYPWSAAS